MQRVAFLLVVSIFLLLGLMFSMPSLSMVVTGTPMSEVAATPTPPDDICPEIASPTAVSGTLIPTGDPFDVRPPRQDAARVFVPSPDGTPVSFYLVTWTLRPGTCIPYEAEGNKKDGAIILTVQQGMIEFTAKQYTGSDAEVRWGIVSSPGQPYGWGEHLTLYPGDWVSMSDRVWFTYTSVGGESAILNKAVVANIPDHAGCAGGCK